MIYVDKFGGSSLADAGQFRKVADIIKADPARRYVVASAPGKRNKADTKVTDMLYHLYDVAVAGKESFEPALQAIADRYSSIAHDLGVDFDVDGEMAIIRANLTAAPNRDYTASRGEYLGAKLLAQFLGYGFLDPAEAIFFDENGLLDATKTDHVLHDALKKMPNAVIPGFYGALPDGTVHTFSRGGSDVTGSIVARAVNADLYENWTDVSGMLAADPRVVENPQTINYLSYQELRELSYMGASVLHEDAVFPVRKAGIPINIRNTNRPEDNGTMIVASLPKVMHHRTITGIAGKKGFSSILIEKSMMNTEVGFLARLLTILGEYGVCVEHCPTGIDTVSLVVETEALNARKGEVIRRLRDEFHPDVLLVEDGLAMLAVVGQGMAYSRGVASRICASLADCNVNIRMLDQGSSELNIIVGIMEEDYETALRAIYKEMIG